MDQELKGAIDVLVQRVEAKTKEITQSKRMINQLCAEAGMEPIYGDIDVNTGSAAATIRADQFYGKTPIVAAREYLETRDRAVAVEEILDALVRGGFDFDSQGWTEELRHRNLSISLGKNTAIFHKLPNGTVGLLKWYPEASKKKRRRKDASGSNGNDTDSVAPDSSKGDDGEAEAAPASE